jgi:hypothetical protein
MADPFKTGDEARDKYLEQAAHANEAATGGSKLSDLYNKDSTIYKEAEKPTPEPIQVDPKPTIDEEGYPVIEQVRTYREDLAGIVNADKLSLARIAMMEGTANKGLMKDTAPLPPKRQLNIMLIVSTALVVLGIGIAGAVFMLVIQRNTLEQPVADTASSEKYIIFSETSEPIRIAGTAKTELGAEIVTLTENFKEEASVKEIVLTEGAGTTTLERAPISELFAATSARMPESLSRTVQDRFFLGLYSQKGITFPFLIYYVESYDIAYPAMLEWEGFMPDDMSWMFPKPQRLGTSTPEFKFKDRVIANSDARSYEDDGGRSAFFYMFIDDHTILMARNADTVRMVGDRLRGAKFQ